MDEKEEVVVEVEEEEEEKGCWRRSRPLTKSELLTNETRCNDFVYHALMNSQDLGIASSSLSIID